MEEKINKFISLSKLFNSNGYSLYMVGGTVRDYLLNIPLSDMDLVTDATPDDMKKFIPSADYTFRKMGSVKFKFEEQSFDITTLRKEEQYQDFRHPSKVTFVKDLKEDFVRRDFTINAMYMDKNLNVLDYANGQKDLEKHILNTVGEADKRIKEDPLRILRALRFSLTYDLTLSDSLSKAIKDNVNLLANLNPQKINQEINKMKNIDRGVLKNVFDNFSINDYAKVID